ncbi:MAG: AraC family transcriptional regulator [Lachnospiraceae bacterium]|nr:AraC family transcriptional regulator [Lachnospiraceae bacterium]
MAKKKERTVEFRFYEIPRQESALALIGEDWKRIYGVDVDNLHFHNLLEIGYCYEGQGILGFENNRMKYETGTFTVIPANFPHTTISEKEDTWEFLFVDVNQIISDIFPDEPAKQRDNLAYINSRMNILNMNIYPDTALIIRKIFNEYRYKNANYREMVKNLLKVLFLEILRLNSSAAMQEENLGSSHVFEQIIPALKYIDLNYNKDLKAADLARECSMSEVHLRRLFYICVNLPPMDYVNFVRIQKACELMLQTNISMDQIAFECGFTSTSTFTRNFRKFMSNTPYQWKIGSNNAKVRLLDYNILAVKGW